MRTRSFLANPFGFGFGFGFGCSVVVGLSVMACSASTSGGPFEETSTAQASVAKARVLPRRLGSIAWDHPSYVRALPTAGDSSLSLVVTSFGTKNFFSNVDAVRVVPKFRDLFASLDPAQVTTVDPRLLVDGGRQGITWPNDAVAVPDGIFPTKGILVTSGFLLPFPKKTGHIQFVEWETGAVTRLDAQRKDREGWFYYHAEWRDMNGDGRLDIVTARAHKPLRGDAEGELLWLEQPMKDAGAGAWQEHVLTPGPNPQGPDANFRFADLDGDGQDEIVAPQFFTGVLSVLWQEGGSWRSRAVDTTVTGYDVQVVDLNGDGRDDVVVSDAEHTNGSLVAYEVPRDFRREPWVRHELGSGYAGRNKWVSYATAPGPVLVSWRQAGVRSGKPVLVVSGENEGTLRVFQPKSEDPTRWDYDDPIVFEAKKGTVGYPAVADMNGDGFDDIVVPAYDDGLLEVLTFAPDGTTP